MGLFKLIRAISAEKRGKSRTKKVFYKILYRLFTADGKVLSFAVVFIIAEGVSCYLPVGIE